MLRCWYRECQDIVRSEFMGVNGNFACAPSVCKSVTLRTSSDALLDVVILKQISMTHRVQVLTRNPFTIMGALESSIMWSESMQDFIRDSCQLQFTIFRAQTFTLWHKNSIIWSYEHMKLVVWIAASLYQSFPWKYKWQSIYSHCLMFLYSQTCARLSAFLFSDSTRINVDATSNTQGLARHSRVARALSMYVVNVLLAWEEFKFVQYWVCSRLQRVCLCVCGCVLDYFFEEIVVDDVFRKCSWRRVQSTRYDWTVNTLFLLQTKLQRDTRRLLLFLSQYHNLYHRKLVKKGMFTFFTVLKNLKNERARTTFLTHIFQNRACD